jgi:ABC-type glycerol-3-phosphate transport system permease component
MATKDVIEATYLAVAGREPFVEEVKTITDILSYNKVRDDDALVMLIATQMAQLSATKDIVNNAKKTIDSSVRNASEQAKSIASSSIETVATEAIGELIKESTKVIHKTAKESVTKKTLWAYVVAFSVGALLFSFGMLNGYVISKKDSRFWADTWYAGIIQAPAIVYLLLFISVVAVKNSLAEDNKIIRSLLISCAVACTALSVWILH